MQIMGKGSSIWLVEEIWLETNYFEYWQFKGLFGKLLFNIYKKISYVMNFNRVLLCCTCPMVDKFIIYIVMYTTIIVLILGDRRMTDKNINFHILAHCCIFNWSLLRIQIFNLRIKKQLEFRQTVFVELTEFFSE